MPKTLQIIMIGAGIGFIFASIGLVSLSAFF